VRDIPRSTFAHQDEARFIPLSAGNGELILLTYLHGPKGLNTCLNEQSDDLTLMSYTQIVYSQ